MRAPVAIVALSSIVHGVAWGFTTKPMGDSPGYRADGITLTTGWNEITDRTPGYPLMLWATGSLRRETVLLFVVQLLLHAAAVLGTVDIARRIGLGARAQVGVAALLMVLPTMVPVVSTGTEALSQALVVATAWFATRWLLEGRPGWAWAMGVSCGVVTWVRPAYAVIFVPLAICAAMTHRSGGWRGACGRAARVGIPAVGLVGMLLCIQAVRFDHATLTPLTGWYLSSRTSAFVEELPVSYEPGRSILIAERDRQLLIADEVDAPNYAFAVRDELATAMGMDRSQLDRWMLEAQLFLIVRHPFEVQKAIGEATLRYIDIESQPAVGALGRPGTWALQLIHLGLQLAFAAVTVTVPGSLLAGRRPRGAKVLAMCTAICLSVAVVAVATETGTSRLRTPTDPLLVLLLIAGASMVVDEARQLRSRRPNAASAIP